MTFASRLKSKEHLNKLVLYLGTDEQQEFLERAEILKKSKDRFYNENIKKSLSNQEYDNEKRYNYLLDKAIIFSRKSNEDRLGILLLTDEDQKKFVYGYLKMRTILDSDETYSGDSNFNLEKYNLLLEKSKSRYEHRSLLG